MFHPGPQEVRFNSCRGAAPRNLDRKIPTAEYIAACEARSTKSCDPKDDERDICLHDEQFDDDVVIAQASKKGAKYARGYNRPPCVLRLPSSQDPQGQIPTFTELVDLMDKQHEDVFKARLTVDARLIETRLHEKYQDLPFGEYHLYCLLSMMQEVFLFPLIPWPSVRRQTVEKERVRKLQEEG